MRRLQWYKCGAAYLDSKSIGRCVSSFMRWCVEVYGWRVVKSGWRAAANSSPPPTSLFIGIPEGLVKSEEYFRVCFHIIFIGQDYDMTTHLPDFCEPSLQMIWSSCIFLRCLRMALLLMFSVLAISWEVIDKNALLFVFWEEYFDFARKNGG